VDRDGVPGRLADRAGLVDLRPGVREDPVQAGHIADLGGLRELAQLPDVSGNVLDSGESPAARAA
jgi:hypothetical protein